MTSPHLSAGMLHTDEYQLTMAQVYFHRGLHERRARFDWFFRSYPDYGEHQAGYAITAGLEFSWLRISGRAARIAAGRALDDVRGERIAQLRSRNERIPFQAGLLGRLSPVSRGAAT